MAKKILSIILVVIGVLGLSVNAFAYPSDAEGFRGNRYRFNNEGSSNLMEVKGDVTVSLDDAVYGDGVKTTEQFLFTITRPEGDEIVFSASYALCGISGTEGLSIAISRYNTETKKYEALADSDGISSWDDINKLFTKEIKLNEGGNKIKVVAYKTADKDVLEPGKNMQVNVFNVTFINSSKRDSIVKSGPSLGDIFNLRGRM